MGHTGHRRLLCCFIELRPAAELILVDVGREQRERAVVMSLDVALLTPIDS